MYENSGEPDQTPRLVASDLGLHYLPMSHKKDDRLKWVNGRVFVCASCCPRCCQELVFDICHCRVSCPIVFCDIVKTLYNDCKNIYNVGSICTNIPVWLEFEFNTKEIKFSIKLFGDKHCRCKEG